MVNKKVPLMLKMVSRGNKPLQKKALNVKIIDFQCNYPYTENPQMGIFQLGFKSDYFSARMYS